MNKFILVILAVILLASQAMKIRQDGATQNGSQQTPSLTESIQKLSDSFTKYSTEIGECNSSVFDDLNVQLEQIMGSLGASIPKPESGSAPTGTTAAASARR